MFSYYHCVMDLQNIIFEKLPPSHFLITMDKNVRFEFCVKPSEPNIATCLIYWEFTKSLCYRWRCYRAVCSPFYHYHFLKNHRFSWHPISPMSPWRSLLRSLVTTVICHTNLRIKHVLLKPILNVHFLVDRMDILFISDKSVINVPIPRCSTTIIVLGISRTSSLKSYLIPTSW